ncbi:MAG: peptide deformylase [Alphaproteobacteria bacterium]|jgi:peptide deformylase|nr:peptide deformylase [Rhodospirillaceae bacterium]MBT6202682.1 peptide deformylase [Rhodospirillaceae bacterium]MBT6509765.1 peptide deformylase [Rhodospirillaceae bacterium]MBT7615093.1 peptide deformylase [Rhodospirillaceae bacterium]MDG2479397.1 peptide deformylase [Alphaproteobacteria bacterium]
MAMLPIIWAPDPRLKVTSEPVGEVDAAIVKLIDDMLATMYAEPGIGLSAIQIGVPKRVVVVDVARKGEEPQPLALINPVITARSSDIAVFDEGCLSLPDHWAEVERPAEIDIRFLDRAGKQQSLHADDILSRCIQHEMDHLDGILFVDHLSAVRRGIILRKLTKQKKARLRENA